MPKETKTTCDNCGRDLTTTTNCEDWCIALINVRIPSAGGAVTAMASEPELERDHYFCEWNCLEGWRRRKRAEWAANIERK